MSTLGFVTQSTSQVIKQIPVPSLGPGQTAIGKSIIVFCDGTGQDGLTTLLSVEETAALKQEKATSPISPVVMTTPYPTNVLRLSRCIPLHSPTEKGRLQLVFYQSGVGAGDDFRGASDFGDDYERARGTATGGKIRDAYNFIAQNYDDGDKIYLFGFSRGAYTARKVAGLICTLGLLDRREMGHFFRYWSALDRNDKTVDIKRGKRAPIQFIGTWDTVGSVYEELSSPKLNALNLVDTELPEGIKTARHALAYHENRKEFLPTPYVGYEKNRDVWFPGAHSDVGGGYNERLIADITLCWMAGEAAKSGLGLDEQFIYDCFTILPKTTSPPELRLHFERKTFLTVDRMKTLVSTPHHDVEVALSNVNEEFMYHLSLWAEIRETPGGSSRKAFSGKTGEPVRKRLTDFEQKYWGLCGWDQLVPLPLVRSRPPAPRGQSPALKTLPLPSPPPSQLPLPQNPVEFECIYDYTQGMCSNTAA
ncbi:choline transport protein [Ceratobasidium sp. AG-Ba]|nr:choline transport protein [Ceratobasidium sp. AG-Ba]